jgi:predicted secreted protein
MITSSKRLVGAAILSIGLIGGGLAGTAPAGAASTTRTVHQADSGKHISMKKHQVLRIDLRTDRHGGYGWAIVAHPKSGVLKVLKKKVTPYAHKPGATGYPFHTIYTLETTGYGSTAIHLAERRSSGSKHVVKRFSLAVKVPRPAAKHACTHTASGSCIQGGEFCKQASYGLSGWDAAGRRYVCTGDQTHPRWRTP